MRFFKYLVLIFLSFISAQVFAVGWFLPGYTTTFYPTAQEACEKALKNGSGTAGTLSVSLVSETEAECHYIRYGTPTTNKAYLKKPPTKCPSSGTEDVKSVPFRLRSSQVCISGCLWNPTSSGGMVCGDNSGMCATDFKSAGTTCSQNTDLTPTQSDIDATKPLDPDNPDPKPDPNPDPNDPNGGSGQGRCNGTNNCNTTNNTNSNNTTNNITNEIDINRIIDAINTSTSDLKSAISSLSSLNLLLMRLGLQTLSLILLSLNKQKLMKN